MMMLTSIYAYVVMYLIVQASMRMYAKAKEMLYKGITGCFVQVCVIQSQ
jgi:hypothetical protein